MARIRATVAYFGNYPEAFISLARSQVPGPRTRANLADHRITFVTAQAIRLSFEWTYCVNINAKR